MNTDPPRQDDRDERPDVVRIRPVVAGKALPTLPRVVVVAVIVGFVAFVAGLRLGPGPSQEIAQFTPLPTPSSSSPSATILPSGSPTVVFGPSEFAGSFEPDRLMRGTDGGSKCVIQSGGVPGIQSPRSVRTLVRVWIASCPIPSAKRVAFLDALLGKMVQEIPNLDGSASVDPRDLSLADFAYNQGSAVGTVTLAAVASGSNLLIAITLQEHIP